MVVRRILLFVLLLAAWIQVAGACTEARTSPEQAQSAMQIVVRVAAGDAAVGGGEQRCECPAMAQNALSTASESSRFLLASYVEGSGALPASANTDAHMLAMRARASSFIAHYSARPPYLLVPRLRQ